MFELIIFDCDGVLIDSEWLANQVEAEELAHLGYPVPFDDYLDIALGRSNDEVEKLLHKIFGIQLPVGYWQSVGRRQREVFMEKLSPIPGILDLLTALPIPFCVASNSMRERLDFTLRVTKLFEHFEGRIYGRECVERGKPEPDIFLHASSQMGVEPKRCLVIEDSNHGIAAAKAAGMEVWAFSGGRHFSLPRKAQLKSSAASYIFDDMASLARHLLGLFQEV